MLINELKSKITKKNITDFVNLWQDYHDYLLSLKKKEITKKECITISRKFKDACLPVHENLCRKIKEHPDKEQRILKCPFYKLCNHSNQMKGHRNYCEIAGNARDFNFEKVKKLLKEVNDDSLNELKNIEESW